MCAVADLYSGLHHVRVMQGVREYRDAGGRAEVGIVSAGYGLVPERLGSLEPVRIVPYDATFSGMSAGRVARLARELDIPDDVQSFLREDGCDIQLVLLGSAYLKACALPESMEFPCPTWFLCAPSAVVPYRATKVPLGQVEARRFSSTLVSLKGVLTRSMLRMLAAGHDLPQDASALLDELERFGV